MIDLEKYKVCPSCGTKNPPTFLECQTCEADLTRVRVIDREKEQHLREEAEEVASQREEATYGLEVVKVCDCGYGNPPQARKCQSCGEDISDIAPKPCVAQPKRYRLSSLADDCSFCLDEPTVIIGREAGMGAYLENKSFVSRQHAKITLVDGEVYIVDLDSTNKTFVNGNQVHGCNPTRIQEGDEISLGGKTLNGLRQDEAAYLTLKAAP